MVGYEKVVLRCGLYPRDIDHRNKKRKSYRSADLDKRSGQAS